MVSKQWSITSCGEFQSSNAQSGEFSSYLTHAVVSFQLFTLCCEFPIYPKHAVVIVFKFNAHVFLSFQLYVLHMLWLVSNDPIVRSNCSNNLCLVSY